MCGIAGIYRLGDRPPGDADRAEDRALVSAMLEAIAYRGPDDSGLESIGRVTLGARRLSILDIAGGHQPLADAERRVWAVQNGEIYNFPELRADLALRHPLRTTTDTELLPYLYREHGRDCVSRLNGMFACAVYDAAEETLLLARDPLGVKPLYVAERGDRFFFASELKALLQVPEISRELDGDAFARYLALGFVAGHGTIVRAVRKVRPGTRIVLGPRRRTEDRYWNWPRFLTGTDGEAGIEAATERGAGLLARSTQSMLLSDRPLGVLLSGGLDSSVMLALLPEAIRRETRTFTIGFPDGGHHDERGHAREVATLLGTRHQEFEVHPDLAAELPRVVSFLDEPCADPAAVPAHLVARAASREVTVLLSGTGGDELFGGYRRHRMNHLLSQLAWLPPSLAGSAARWLTGREQNRRTVGGERMVMIRKLLEARSRPSSFDAYLSTIEPGSPALWSESLAPGVDRTAVGASLYAELVAELGHEPGSPDEAVFAADHLYYLPDYLLLKEDRTTMGASVEGRVPFLAVALVEFAAALPLASRFDGLQGKRLLRRIARRHLPSHIVDRPKHGFSVPIVEWLRGPLRGLAGDVFAGQGSGMFRMGELRRWNDLHQRGVDRSGPLWAALCFELWWTRIGSAPAGATSAVGVAS